MAASTMLSPTGGILDKKAGSKNGKSARKRPAQPPIKCPECGSQKIWKDGLRHTNLGTVQRYICRNCAYRFSDPDFQHAFNGSDMFQHVQNVLTKKLKRHADIPNLRQVCVALTEGTKNLATSETRQEKAAGATKPDTEAIKGLLVKYIYWLEKEGYYKDSVYPDLLSILAKKDANLFDPEDVKAAIAKQPWKDSVKRLAVYAYDAMVKMLNIEWTKPKYKPKDTLPFVPDEAELDQLIATTQSRRLAAYLQTLKETFADPGEILRLEWVDIDSKHNVITINHPVKGHNAGQATVSTKLIAMLNALPKTSERVFPTTYENLYLSFRRVRKRAARQLQNPRLLKIRFTTFRHWGGTMIAYYTNGNVLKVKEILRHKNVQNTMKYIHMVHFKDPEEFEVASATTAEEIKQLAAAGFQKVDEIHGIHIFRRPKRFRKC